MGAENGIPDYDVDLPADGGPDGGSTGDDNSRGADTSRATTTGAPNGRQPAGDGTGDRPDSSSSAGSTQPARGHMVPSGLLRDANRTVRALQRELARLQQGGGNQGDRQPAAPPRVDHDVNLTPEEREIKNQLFKIAPFLRRLEGVDADALDKVLRLNPEQIENVINEVAPRSVGLEKLYWQRNAHTHLREVDAVVREEYGTNVDPRAVRRYQAAFIDWLETDPEARERYLDGDPTLVKDFWAETTSLMVNPIRDKASSEATTRAERVSRLPVMPARGGVVGQPRRAEKKPKDENELHDQAWNALVERAAAMR